MINIFYLNYNIKSTRRRINVNKSVNIMHIKTVCKNENFSSNTTEMVLGRFIA